MVILGGMFHLARRRGLRDRIVSGTWQLEGRQRHQDEHGVGQNLFRMDRVSSNQQR